MTSAPRPPSTTPPLDAAAMIDAERARTRDARAWAGEARAPSRWARADDGRQVVSCRLAHRARAAQPASVRAGDGGPVRARPSLLRRRRPRGASRVPNMNTLVVLGTSAAWLYSTVRYLLRPRSGRARASRP